MPSVPVAVAVLGSAVLAVAVAWRLSRPGQPLRESLPDRFYYGLPWGTLVVIGVVLAVYLFVQGGLRNWNRPLVIPFRAWSYLYPTGMVTAGFAHSSPGHLVGNLIGTVVLGPIAEYAWGHYPASPDADRDRAVSGGTDRATSRGSDRVRRWLRVPWVRAFVAFPAAVLAVGLLTAPFLLGPVIGFSGVVFALGGFALVQYPIATLVALWLSSVVRVAYLAVTDPVVTAGISRSAPGPPGWATIAIQGHALGVLVGVLAGLALLVHRRRRPDPGRVFLAALVYAVTRDLWAVYWYEGEGQYVLFRAGGFVLVLVLAVIVTAGVAARDRPITAASTGLPQRLSARHLAGTWLGVLVVGAIALLAAATVLGWPLAPTALAAGIVATLLATPAVAVLLPRELEVSAPTGRQVAFGTLLVATAALSGIAVFPNLGTVDATAVSGDEPVEVGDYRVTYAEDVRNGMIPAIDVRGLENATDVRTSGVIVVSERRHVWQTAVNRQYLESEGNATVTLGGAGWRETVRAERTGWVVAGNETVYAVDLVVDGERTRPFTSTPVRADVLIADHTVTVVPTDDAFVLRVRENGTLVGEAPIPAAGTETTVGELSLATRVDDDTSVVFAATDDTVVRVARQETYQDQ